MSFVIDASDFAFYERIKVPPPTFCPECRMIRRMEFRNERALYRRNCKNCGKDTITVYAPRSPFVVYCNECWYSDHWNPTTFASPYDFSLPFFVQLQSLWRRVPQPAINSIQNVNSPYVNFAVNNKDCFLVAGALENENCAYSTRILHSNDCFDVYDVSKSSLCYECDAIDASYGSVFVGNSESVAEAICCYNCKGISSAIGCVNLRNKNYHIFNQPVSKEMFMEQLQKEFDRGSYKNLTNLRERFYGFSLQFPRRFASVIKSVNSDGEFIHASKNVQNSFSVRDSENLKFTALMGKVKDAMDIYADDESELGYEVISGQTSLNYQFDVQCWYSQNIRCSVMSQSSSNLFGCIGLRNKSYCILNKQYTKEEYEALMPQIIDHMNTMPYVDKMGRVYTYGEFFPPELSPFAYNETIAQEYFPLTKEEALARGYYWKDPEEGNYAITKTTDQIPDHIKDVPDSILQDTIQCLHNQTCNEQCTQAFKIIPQELQFYRKIDLPLPRLCPNCRHYQRLKQRNPLKLWHRTCACVGAGSENNIYKNTVTHFHGETRCPNEFETSYAPDRPEIVYCEQCYQAEVV